MGGQRQPIVSRTLLTAKCALAAVVKGGIALAVQPAADDVELASDLRTCDVVEKGHLTGFRSGDQVDLDRNWSS